MTHSKIDHYKNSGVDSTKGDALVEWLQDHNQSYKSVLAHPKGLGEISDGIGGFAGLFKLNSKAVPNPVLVASTDGVGTKLLLAIENNQCRSLGQDLVAMCVNDLYTVGADPLFFLDYYATGILDESQFKDVLSSIQAACRTCQMSLLGGETAEMPGLYGKGHFDLAGFVVGIVDDTKRLGPHRTKAGDHLIAIHSSGFHANGFSLIRKWLKAKPRPDLVEQLLEPTILYRQVPTLVEQFPDDFHALAHITGGGISGNLPRVMGRDQKAVISNSKLPIPPWMKEFILSNDTNISDVEQVFNLGVGMIAIVDPRISEKFRQSATDLGLDCTFIGEIHPHTDEPIVDYV